MYIYLKLLIIINISGSKYYYSVPNHKGIWTDFLTCAKKSPPCTSLHNYSSKFPNDLEQKIYNLQNYNNTMNLIKLLNK